jgi:UDP-perosamine 4-acetyltransferase
LSDRKKFAVVMPRVNANDDSALLVNWKRQAGEAVRNGDLIAQIETTKAAVDLEAHADGYIHPLAAPGAMVSVGTVIAWIIDPYEPALIGAAEASSETPVLPERGRIVSRKAAELMAAKGLSAADFPINATIKEADVRVLLAARSGGGGAEAALVQSLAVTDQSVALFGAADQGIVVADCLRAAGVYEPFCFVDETPRTSELGSVPVFDPSVLDDLLMRGIRLAHVCIGAPEAKLRIATKLKETGFTIIQAIHPKAMVSPEAQLGEGVYIGPGVVIGPKAIIGDFSQINNNATVAHHAQIGVAVRISDGVHLAGGVRVGDYSYLGLGVTVNTNCHIGSAVTIVSGVSVFDTVPDRTVVRSAAIRKL